MVFSTVNMRIYLTICLGYARHRALLYKYLADSISLPARLNSSLSTLHGPGDTAYNSKSGSNSRAISVVEVFVSINDVEQWCVVDLIKDIGELYDLETESANAYKKSPTGLEDGNFILFLSFL